MADMMTQEQLEEKILELVDRRDDFTRSDLQGAVGALARQALPTVAPNAPGADEIVPAPTCEHDRDDLEWETQPEPEGNDINWYGTCKCGLKVVEVYKSDGIYDANAENNGELKFIRE